MKFGCVQTEGESYENHILMVILVAVKLTYNGQRSLDQKTGTHVMGAAQSNSQPGAADATGSAHVNSGAAAAG